MDPRDDRMKLRKNNEEVFRFRLRLEAQEKCKAESSAFGECAKNNGLLVLFNCRQQNKISKYS